MASASAATRWILLGSIGFRIVSLAGTWLILDLVDKDTFGAYGAVIGLHVTLMVLLPGSLDVLYVREKARRRRYAIASAGMLALTGGILAAAAALLSLLPTPTESSIASRVMGLGGDFPMLFFMAPIFLVQAMKMYQRGLLSAELDFKRISIGEFGNGLITWLGGAIGVLTLPPAWGLMAAYLLGEIFECWWMYRGRAFAPLRLMRARTFQLMTKLVRRHAGFCLFNTSNMGLNNFAAQAPGLLLVALIAKEANADFRVAMTLLVLPVMLLVGSIYRVTFPVISGVKEEELQERCLTIIGGASAFIAPCVIWLGFFAESMALLLGREKYLSAAPMVKWMTLQMIFVAVYSPISSITMVRDRAGVSLTWNLAYLVVRLAAIALFARDGALAAIAAMSIASAVLWAILAGIFGHMIGAGPKRFWGAAGRFVPLWLLASAGFWIAGRLTGGHPVWAPLASIPACIVYTALVWKFHPREADLLRRLIPRARRG
jgi:O-antigen/teichoic acid export membrane protein